MFVSIFCYDLNLFFLGDDYLIIFDEIIVVNIEFVLFKILIRCILIIVVIMCGIVFLLLFMIVFIFIFLRIESFVEVFLIISIMFEIEVLVFLYFGKWKLKF